MGHRFYDPSSGRFLSRDPAGAGNLYAYADGNPEDESDPTGFDADPNNNPDDPGYIPGGLSFSTNAGQSVAGAWGGFAQSPQFANGSVQRQDTSNGLQQLPGVGPLLCGYIAVTGCDPIAGTPVSGLNRGFALLGALGPMFEALQEARWCEMLGNGCFAKNTIVLMADGTHKPIQNIQVGDWVMARNEATGQTEARQVTATTAHLSLQTVTVTLTDPKTHKTQAIVCTPNHPFYVAGQGFTPAGSLGIGTSIVTRAGPCLAVSNVQFQPASAGGAMVYTLTVEGDHTYFVGTLDGGAWVHNNACGAGYTELYHYTDAEGFKKIWKSGYIDGSQGIGLWRPWKTGDVYLSTNPNISPLQGLFYGLSPAKQEFVVPVCVPTNQIAVRPWGIRIAPGPIPLKWGY